MKTLTTLVHTKLTVYIKLLNTQLNFRMATSSAFICVYIYFKNELGFYNTTIYYKIFQNLKNTVKILHCFTFKY